MNQLDVIKAPSKYIEEPHEVITIDGIALDVMLDAARPDLRLLGLVPALFDWLTSPEERELVRERILPAIGSSAIAPVLICPDDLDLTCSVVVAEVVREPSVIWWWRIGLDTTEAKPAEWPSALGGRVNWVDGLGPFCFEAEAYERFLAVFGIPKT